MSKTNKLQINPSEQLSDAELDMHFKNYLSGLNYTSNIPEKADGGIVHGKPGVDTNFAKIKPGSFIIPKNKIKAAKKAGIIDNKPANKMQAGGTPIKISAGEAIIEPEKAKSLYNMGVDLNKFAPESNHKYSPNKAEGGTILNYNNPPVNIQYPDMAMAQKPYIQPMGNPDSYQPSRGLPGDIQGQNNPFTPVVNKYQNNSTPVTPQPKLYFKGGKIYYQDGGVAELPSDSSVEQDRINSNRDYKRKMASDPGSDWQKHWWENATIDQQINRENNNNAPLTPGEEFRSSYNTNPINSANNNQPNKPGVNTPNSDYSDINNKANTVYGLEAAATVGEGLYNVLQKYHPSPKPGLYTPQLYHPDTAALKATNEADITRAGATQRYNQRNSGQTDNPSVYATDVNAKLKSDANINQIEEHAKEKNIGTLNQASLYNLGQANQYGAREADRNAKFRLMKGQAISQNISELGNIGEKSVNTDIGLKYGEKSSQLLDHEQALGNLARTNPEEAKRISLLPVDQQLIEMQKLQQSQQPK